MQNDMQKKEIMPPTHLPFLEAICWQTNDIYHFTLDEMLDCYERGWKYHGILGTLEGQERNFVHQLATDRNSWLSLEI